MMNQYQITVGMESDIVNNLNGYTESTYIFRIIPLVLEFVLKNEGVQ